ncbi:hypothetical protein DH2020_011461 [Rehmannia glutinosa]|uniref:Wound-responsive family protein n=1 Tax=Rehmannia glutinosa TaxID=99300 RepID=A0ABR0XE25_REHGL
MSATRCSKAWIVAASVGAVEALKDQGFCRWNYAIRSIHHNARNRVIRSFSQAKQKLNSNHKGFIGSGGGDEKRRQSEDSLRQVMYLNCWGQS